ncbi:MAG: Crp/Fnr family transcriptional regulator [Methylococcales bacterium]
MNLELTTKLLSENPLFSQLGEDELAEIITFSRTRSVDKEQVIFHKWDESGQLFVLLKGRIQISSVSDTGKEIILNLVEPVEIFGEISLFDEMERTATAMTLDDSELLVISRQDFIPYLERNPRIAIKMLDALSQLLRQTNILIEDVLFRNLANRLAKKIISLAGEHGEDLSDGTTRIKLALSHTQLGNMINSSRESVCRQLRAWENEEIISMDHGHILVRNFDHLKLLYSS